MNEMKRMEWSLSIINVEWGERRRKKNGTKNKFPNRNNEKYFLPFVSSFSFAWLQLHYNNIAFSVCIKFTVEMWQGQWNFLETVSNKNLPKMAQEKANNFYWMTNRSNASAMQNPYKLVKMQKINLLAHTHTKNGIKKGNLQ